MTLVGGGVVGWDSNPPHTHEDKEIKKINP